MLQKKFNNRPFSTNPMKGLNPEPQLDDFPTLSVALSPKSIGSY